MAGVQDMIRQFRAGHEMSLARRDPGAFQTYVGERDRIEQERASRPQIPHSASNTAGLAAWEGQFTGAPTQTAGTPTAPTTQRSPIGKTGALGLVSEQLAGGLAKKKKKAAARMARSRQGLSSQALGQSPLSKDLVGR